MHTMTIEQYVRQVTGMRFSKIPLDGKSRAFRDNSKRRWHVVGFDDVRVLWSRDEVHSIIAGSAKVIDMQKSRRSISGVVVGLMMLANTKDPDMPGLMKDRYLPAVIDAAIRSGEFITAAEHDGR